MREIKFRAWVGKMEYDVVTGRFGTFFVNSGVNGDGLDVNDSASLTPFNTKYPDRTPVMLFTGLKDKNGVDIYEGDVVSYMGNAHQVRWDIATASFQIDASSAVSDQEVGVDLTESIVIGNIYEGSLEE